MNSKYLSLLYIIYVYYVVSSNGSVTYSEVIAFLKRDPTALLKNPLITTLYNESIILSGDHLFFVKKSLVVINSMQYGGHQPTNEYRSQKAIGVFPKWNRNSLNSANSGNLIKH